MLVRDCIYNFSRKLILSIKISLFPKESCLSWKLKNRPTNATLSLSNCKLSWFFQVLFYLLILYLINKKHEIPWQRCHDTIFWIKTLKEGKRKKKLVQHEQTRCLFPPRKLTLRHPKMSLTTALNATNSSTFPIFSHFHYQHSCYYFSLARALPHVCVFPQLSTPDSRAVRKVVTRRQVAKKKNTPTLPTQDGRREGDHTWHTTGHRHRVGRQRHTGAAEDSAAFVWSCSKRGSAAANQALFSSEKFF